MNVYNQSVNQNNHARSKSHQRQPHKIKVKDSKRSQTELCVAVPMYQMCMVGKKQVVITGSMYITHDVSQTCDHDSELLLCTTQSTFQGVFKAHGSTMDNCLHTLERV